MSAGSIGQTAFLGLRGRETLNRRIPGRLAGTVDQNWAKLDHNRAKTLPREAGWSICGAGKNGNSGLIKLAVGPSGDDVSKWTSVALGLPHAWLWRLLC